MKTKVRYILFTALLIVFSAGCARNNVQYIVAVEETRTYHISTCAKITMAKTVTISRDEAIRKQLQPCPHCKPDKSL